MDKESLVRETIDLQRKANKATRQNDIKVWMSLPISIAQLKTLFFIVDQGGTSPGELALALGVTTTNTTGIIDRLLKQELVSRAENPENRRRLIIRATGKGEDLVTNLRERRAGPMCEILDYMSMGELITLSQGLRYLLKAAETREQRSAGS
jgi:DNA-binding MarR family transcriptional regulator